MNKKIPNLVELKSKCCGCAACYAICPQNAISMVLDEEGFNYPKIEHEKCIGCYKCVKVCPI
ncbi:4Fe-4S dicluster-binding protein [Blautia sp. HCP3S3_D9]|uniref:4Fe-4S dicluster-binding protein n=1 Tax=Blautia sp. HCP3S3_D9 TaxID=3438912 RepID=UPI003F8BA66A